jgi:hypothetical protein
VPWVIKYNNSDDSMDLLCVSHISFLCRDYLCLPKTTGKCLKL